MYDSDSGAVTSDTISIDMYQAMKEHGARVDKAAMVTFETGATRSADNGDKLHYRRFFSAKVARRRAEYMQTHRKQADGTLRDPDNWKKGMARGRYADSLTRHVAELNELLESHEKEERSLWTPSVEEKLCAIMFNAEGLLYELLINRSIKDVSE